ncbi:MAG: hypothetical protein NTU47_04155 [Ignavibacteriales bacterium]|nr:hypothetical protein [Ignavibacteriales bacterium]
MKNDNHVGIVAIDHVKEYLLARNIPFTDRVESSVVIPDYGDENNVAEVVISYSRSQDIVTIIVSGAIPVELKDETRVLFRLNALNSTELIGSYLIFPASSHVSYRMGVYLMGQKLTGEFLDKVLKDAFDSYLKCAKLAPASKEGDNLEPAPTVRSG